MLILIAGVTGNVGRHAARYGLKQGHRIRGLGRSPGKLNTDVRDGLESFVVSKTYWDIAALDQATNGVDAVICAYSGLPELHLDAQLLLFRAAERAGVRRFLAATWNYDWRRIPFGSEPIYDPLKSFYAHVSITSSLKPLYIISGMLAEVFFGIGGQAGFTPKNDGVWDPEKKSMDIWGTGNENWFFTTEEDAGAFGVEVITALDAEEGGFVNLCSFVCSLRELAESYRQVTGNKVAFNEKGSLKDLETKAAKGRDESDRSQFWKWHRLVFHLNTVSGVWNLTKVENERFPKLQTTAPAAFIKGQGI